MLASHHVIESNSDGAQLNPTHMVAAAASTSNCPIKTPALSAVLLSPAANTSLSRLETAPTMGSPALNTSLSRLETAPTMGSFG